MSKMLQSGVVGYQAKLSRATHVTRLPLFSCPTLFREPPFPELDTMATILVLFGSEFHYDMP